MIQYHHSMEHQRTNLFVIIASSVISVGIILCAVLINYIVNFPAGVMASVHAYPTCSKVGVDGEILGTVARTTPDINHGGLIDQGVINAYPQYGQKSNFTAEQKNQIIAENNLLCGVKTANATGSYTWLDCDGNLFNGTTTAPEALNRKLYRHVAAADMYYGNVADDEPAVVKKLTFWPRSYDNYYEVTGLYAPAGEVIKVQISDDDMQATGGLIFHIGQALYNGQANNIWSARDFNRMPVILNTLWITKDTATYDEVNQTWTGYIGSFLGGPIYLRDEKMAYSVTISGAVQYAHFILGKTTPEAYAELVQSSAPYFDLEIWETGVLHSGAKSVAEKFTYEELFQAATLWEKISLVTTKVKNHGVVFIYDPFVAAGAAVAFPGRWSVNCPAGWLKNSLDYDLFISSGNWGNLHEYHHNFQNFGVGATGEVTNNALNLVSYSLFTDISAVRTIDDYGAGELSGWNRYTSATWALKQVNQGGGAITGTNGLSVYATLLHNLGPDALIKTTGATNAAYFNRWAEFTHQDFSYYINAVKDYVTNYEAILSGLAANDYPMFVLVACVYQTGRSYDFDGEPRYIQTMRPYTIPYGETFEIDLNPYSTDSNGQYQSGSIVIGQGFQYRIKRIDTHELNGRLVATNQPNVYTLVPNQNIHSGKIYVTLEITTTAGEKQSNHKNLADVDLVLEFQQTHETKGRMLERTVYTFLDDQTGKDARDIFDTGYAGATAETIDNINPVQNSNTDIWFSLNANEIDSRQVMEVKGKLYFADVGKYRIYLRGRGSCALYLSRNGVEYKCAAYVDQSINPNTANFVMKAPTETEIGTYTDVEINTSATWLYFKEVLVVAPTNYKGKKITSFIGMGLKQWAPQNYTIVEKYYDKNDREIASNTSADYRYTKTFYYDADGNVIDPGIIKPNELQEPNLASKDVPYAFAYRESYHFVPQFVGDYFYRPDYKVAINQDLYEQISPRNHQLKYYGNWHAEPGKSNFGQLCVGRTGAELNFTFEGTQFVLLGAGQYQQDLMIYVDGVLLMPAAVTSCSDIVTNVIYLSQTLTAGKHRIVLRCRRTIEIDSIAWR